MPDFDFNEEETETNALPRWADLNPPIWINGEYWVWNVEEAQYEVGEPPNDDLHGALG